MRREEQVPDLAAGEVFGQQVAQGEEIAEALAHLLAFDEQVRAVQPMFHERFSRGLGAGTFALSDLIFVMRKDQILAADMDFHEELPKVFPHFPQAKDPSVSSDEQR